MALRHVKRASARGRNHKGRLADRRSHHRMSCRPRHRAEESAHADRCELGSRLGRDRGGGPEPGRSRPGRNPQVSADVGGRKPRRAGAGARRGIVGDEARAEPVHARAMRSGTGPRQAGGSVRTAAALFRRYGQSAGCGITPGHLHHDAARAKLRRSDQGLVQAGLGLGFSGYLRRRRNPGVQRSTCALRIRRKRKWPRWAKRCSSVAPVRSIFRVPPATLRRTGVFACKSCQTLSPMPAREAP